MVGGIKRNINRVPNWCLPPAHGCAFNGPSRGLPRSRGAEKPKTSYLECLYLSPTGRWRQAELAKKVLYRRYQPCKEYLRN